MFRKLYGGLLAAAWQNACNLHAPNDTHMLVYSRRRRGYEGEDESYESSKTVSLDQSARLSDHLMDGEVLVGVYALSKLTAEDRQVGSETFDEKFEAAKISYGVVNGEIVFNTLEDAEGEHLDNMVALDAHVA